MFLPFFQKESLSVHGGFADQWDAFHPQPKGCSLSPVRRTSCVFHLPDAFVSLSLFDTSACLDSKICPAMDHAALVHVNSMLETIPVRTEVDDYIGIDYSLTNDPLVTSRSLDMNFRVRVVTFWTWNHEDLSDIYSLCYVFRGCFSSCRTRMTHWWTKLLNQSSKTTTGWSTSPCQSSSLTAECSPTTKQEYSRRTSWMKGSEAKLCLQNPPNSKKRINKMPLTLPAMTDGSLGPSHTPQTHTPQSPPLGLLCL